VEYLVEVYAPRWSATGLLPELGEQLARAAADVSRGGRRVSYLQAILVPEDETCFLLYEASSPTAVADAAGAASVAFERIVAASSADAD